MNYELCREIKRQVEALSEQYFYYFKHATTDELVKAYVEFVKSKIDLTKKSGFTVSDDRLHPSCKPHQRVAIKWALELGRALVGMSFGLGKTQIGLELARLVHEETGQPFLIVCPLGVKHQFVDEDGKRLGMDVRYVRTDDEVEKALKETPYLITNYERVADRNIMIERWFDDGGILLDEGSILRNMSSKQTDMFMNVCRNIKYRFVGTATPSPNEYLELINYAHFLGVMDRGQTLTRYFKRDSQKAGNLTLMESMEHQFWLWVASWALIVTKPSDLGFSNVGYDYPEPNIIWHRLPVDHKDSWKFVDNNGQHLLFADTAKGLGHHARHKRETIDDRLAKAKEIMAELPDTTHWLLWHHLEDERRELEEHIPDCKTVFGSQELEKREELILGFSHGDYRILATKPEIAGSGCNFQRHCHNVIFMGINYKFNDFIQALSRVPRYGQPHKANIHIIFTEAEDYVADTLKRKWQQHNELMAQMQEIINKYGLSHDAMKQDMQREIGVWRQEKKGEFFTLVNNDATLEVLNMPDNSADMILTSIPFGNHYEYSANYNDFGHNSDDNQFLQQMDFLTSQLYRVLKAGRIACIHVKDRILYGNMTGLGMSIVNDFHAKCLEHYKRHGFHLLTMITVTTDVVRENNQTYRLGWSENAKDSTKMGTGSSEYILVFRKLPSDTSNAYADVPVTKSKEKGDSNYYSLAEWQVDAHQHWKSSGDTFLRPEDLIHLPLSQVTAIWNNHDMGRIYDYDYHVAIGEGLEDMDKLSKTFMTLKTNSNHDTVWTDVNRMLTLNANQARRQVEQHICPFQIDIVRRLIKRYTNEGELVYDPFMGIGTVGYCAIEMGRRAYGTELNTQYWLDSVKYCEEAENKRKVPTLFDLMKYEVEKA